MFTSYCHFDLNIECLLQSTYPLTYDVSTLLGYFVPNKETLTLAYVNAHLNHHPKFI